MNEIDSYNRYGVLSDDGTLTLERWLPGPAERIWRYLTEGELLREWLASGEMPSVPGAAFELVWHNDDLSRDGDAPPYGIPDEQRMASHIVAINPKRLLTFAWGNGTVTFELTPKGERVVLTITHRGLKSPAAKIMISAGWHMHADILEAILSGTAAESFWSGWKRLWNVYAQRFRS